MTLAIARSSAQMGDPDIAIPVLAFTEQQARTKRGVLRFLIKYQGYLFLIWELFGWVMFLVSSIDFTARRKGRYRLVQTGLMVVYYCLYFGLLFPRNRLKQAQQIVQACCRECGLSYHETGFLQSYREIFEHLRRVSASTVAPSIPTR